MYTTAAQFNDDEQQEQNVHEQRRETTRELARLFESMLKMAQAKPSPSIMPDPFGFMPKPDDPLSQLVQQTWFPKTFSQSQPKQKVVQQFVEGLKAYQCHSSERPNEQLGKVIWQQGTTKLRDYGGDKPQAKAIFVIPSLINRFDILDLASDHSLLRFMGDQGLRPLVLDWGEPGDEEKNFTIGDYITKRILPALEYLAPRIAGGRLHVMGYCMGGLLALVLTLILPEIAQSLTLMATPWNFAAAGYSAMAATGEAFLSFADQIEPYLTESGCFPASALRAFFASFQPLQVMEKFARFASLDPTSAEAHRFVLSEDWINNGVPLSAPVARECLRDWYGENKPGKILWRVNDILIDPRLITRPAYIIVPGKDKLVPPESAKPLARLIRGSTLREPKLGHIGLLASNAAPQEVWKPLTRWLLEA